MSSYFFHLAVGRAREDPEVAASVLPHSMTLRRKWKETELQMRGETANSPEAEEANLETTYSSFSKKTRMRRKRAFFKKI